ncbi:hypothetical protein VTO73DRAFT_12070 [Trametes versicolor]
MLDDCIGTCLTALAMCVCDACSGVCLDFWTTRHTCTNRVCKCGTISEDEYEDAEPGERDPLIQDAQPESQLPMKR